MSPSRIGQIATAPLLVALFAFFAIRETRAPEVPTGQLAPTDFSEANAMQHVRQIAQRPHPIGSADHDRVRDYILGQLAALGLASRVQRATETSRRHREPVQIQNIVARLPGTTGSSHAVLMVAHYDGVPAGPAASDDAAGCAALLDVLRAIKAGPPLKNDLIVLFSDGEEAGLLGADAFVRSDPWMHDVDAVLNFEARGTTGRAFMFETGPGNLDLVSVLRRAPHVAAASIFVTVYRSLPNDTDLSRFIPRGLPALNFAFTGGVENYHTATDDVAHLDPRSLQQHGELALAVAVALGNDPLPRPKTNDAVFFTLPFVGLLLYPVSWAVLLAVVACVLVIVVYVRLPANERRPLSLVFGAVGLLGTIIVGIFASRVIARTMIVLGTRGPSAPYTIGVLATSFAIALAMYSAVRRFAKPTPSPDALHAGALTVWALLNFAMAFAAPGGSYLLTWPLVFASLGALLPGRRARVPGGWIAAFVAIAILAPLTYVLSAVILGVSSPAGAVSATIVGLLAWLLAPQLELITSERREADRRAVAR